LESAEKVLKYNDSSTMCDRRQLTVLFPAIFISVASKQDVLNC